MSKINVGNGITLHYVSSFDSVYTERCVYQTKFKCKYYHKSLTFKTNSLPTHTQIKAFFYETNRDINIINDTIGYFQ